MSAPVWVGMTVEAATRFAGGCAPEESVRIAAAARCQGPEEDRRYSWIEDHLARLDGREARASTTRGWIDRLLRRARHADG